MTYMPDEITIRCLSASGAPIENIMVFVRIHATHKNDYVVGPLLSDGDGLCRLTRAAVQAEIADAMHLFPMDYSSTLEQCSDTVTVVLESTVEMERRIATVERYWPDRASALSAALTRARRLLQSYEFDFSVGDFSRRSGEGTIDVVVSPEALLWEVRECP